MAKTKPIGVRFDEDLLSVLKEDEKCETAQQSINFLSNFYRDNKKGRIDFVEKFKNVKFEKHSKDNFDGIKTNLNSIDEVGNYDENNEEILRQLESARNEKIPSYATSILGKQIWQRDQQKKIKQLESQLK